MNPIPFTRLALALLIAFPLLVRAADQTPNAPRQDTANTTITGSIKDANGKPIGNTTVHLLNQAGAEVASTQSASDGSFNFKNIAPGIYSLEAENKDGTYASVPANVKNIPLDLGVIALAPIQTLGRVAVAVKRLDIARNGLSPDTGSSIYRFDQQDISNLPLGDSTPLNQVILRAPGVVQDSFGQLHVRGDHANLQYRINGVVIPEAISGFGQALSTRFADQINILTGALPAQYGYRTAGVVDIQTKGTSLENGGQVSYLGGGNGHQETSAEVGGTQGALSYFLTGSLLRDNLGIENPTPKYDAVHDVTKQENGFGYLSYLLDADSRVSFLFGNSDNKFQIPNQPGLTSTFPLNGVSNIQSDDLNARQDEKNSFQILAYQSAINAKVDYQFSLFHRYTDVHYQPDDKGDLMFNGIAAQILRKNDANGMQGDLSWRVTPQHTVRTGLFASQERFTTDNTSQVFPADSDGNPTSDVPFTIVDNSRIKGHTWGTYAQDEWKPTAALTVNYGARFDSVNTVVNESQLSPRLGLVYDFNAQNRFHMGYARYFTPPPTETIDTTSINAFLGTTNALPSDANTAVKSERSDYFDMGFSHQLTHDITVGIDGYYRRVRHLQDEGQFGNALIFSAFNYEKGKVYGAELSTSYHKNNLSGYINASYTAARGRGIETGQFNFEQDELDYIANNWVHLDHEQSWSGAAGVSYKWADTTYSADLIYGSGLRNGFANTGHLPGYTQTNLGVVHAFNFTGFGKLDARLSLINVFDKSYELRDGTGIGVGAPQYAPRRTLYAGLSKPF